MGHTSVPEEAYAKMLATKVQLGDAMGLYEMLIEEQSYGRQLVRHLRQAHDCEFPVSHANGLIDTGDSVASPYQVRDMSVQQILDSVTFQQYAELAKRLTDELSNTDERDRFEWAWIVAIVAVVSAGIVVLFAW